MTLDGVWEASVGVRCWMIVFMIGIFHAHYLMVSI